MIKYSIVTPVKAADVAKLPLLKNNIDKQGTTDLEWLIIGDDTLDKSALAFTAEYEISVLTVPNSTVGKARNLGLKQAQGEYLIFIDADDFLLPKTLQKYWPVISKFDITDLNQYPTYEPESSFLTSIAGGNAEDYLPDWGGSHRKTHVDWHKLDVTTPVSVPSSTIAAKKNYNAWLSAKYRVFNTLTVGDVLNRMLRAEGKAVRREFANQINADFDATNLTYADYQFTLNILDHVTQVAQLNKRTYFKERHNDPINDPSLSQGSFFYRWHGWISAWLTELPKLQHAKLKTQFAEYTLGAVHRYFYNGMMGETTNDERTILLTQLQQYLAMVPETAIKSVGHSSRIIFKKVAKGKFTAATKQMKRTVAARYFRRALVKHGRGMPRAMYQFIFTKFPVKDNVIIYESFLGRNYSDSPKYIYEYMRNHFPGKYKHVWIVAKGADVAIPKHKDTVTVRRFSFRYMYYMAISKYQVFNMRQPQWFAKRPGTTFLSTWHGTPLKHLVFDMDNVASANPLYKQIFYHQSRQWDYLVTANQFSVDVFEHAFMYPVDKMIKSGYPRNDILNAPDKDQRQQAIKAKLGIPQDKKVILYAPTWRDDQYYGVGQYKFDLELDIPRLKAALGDEYVLVLRTHYFIADHLDTSGFGDFVFNESSYDDIAELYLISDILITDYSSVFFDYAVLQRPILYFVYDYDKYASVLRGFYLDMNKDLPGPLLRTNDEVLNAIENIDQVNVEYHDRYRQFNERFNAWEDGHATERVVNTAFFNKSK